MRRHALIAVLAAGLLAAAPARAGESVLVFAAASTTDAVQAVLDAFRERHPDTAVRTSFAASSTLAKQIARGAPADVYLSANVDWMNYLAERGAIARDSRVDLLANRLVLIAPRGSDLPAAIERLPEALGARPLAMGNPDHVPAGIYAKQALESLGLWAALKPRAAFGHDVRAALALVGRGEAAAGIVYATDARISDTVVRKATFPADSHAPIRYPLARAAGHDRPAVRRVTRFLRSAEAAAIFRDHGFTVRRPADG
jgi:molybdate transport system substrate-binding protein